MDSTTNLVILLVSGMISLAILYYIIANAVKSGTEDLLFYTKMHYRLQIEKMMKEGFTYDQIVSILTGSDDDFWNKIRQKYPKEIEMASPAPLPTP